MHALKDISANAAKSPHLNERVPVGDRFSRICQHFIPVISAKGVRIVANATHTDDLIMAYTVGAGGREKNETWMQPLHRKSNAAYTVSQVRKQREKKADSVKL